MNEEGEEAVVVVDDDDDESKESLWSLPFVSPIKMEEDDGDATRQEIFVDVEMTLLSPA